MIIRIVLDDIDDEAYAKMYEEADRVYSEYVKWRESEEQTESHTDSD